MPQLGFNLLAATLQHVHGDVRLIAILQIHGGLANLYNLVRGE
jgi:hypothetical protein